VVRGADAGARGRGGDGVSGGGLEGLLAAAQLSRQSADVSFDEPGLRAGGELVTESFLTPFRFNLGPGIVHRGLTSGLRVLEPDPLLAVGAARLGRAPVSLEAHGTVPETLDRSGVESAEQRTLHTALAVLLGVDPLAAGSGVALAAAAGGLDDLVLVSGGNGLVAASLLDEIVAGGGRVSEGNSPWSPEPVPDSGLGTCRLFVGVRGRGPALNAFATAHGFIDEETLLERLADLRQGVVSAPVGFVLSNAHLDVDRPGDPLASFVWQGLLPAAPGPVARDRYVSDVLESVSVAETDVIFRLLWLPADTRELLGSALALSATG
jgi:hypothetical protein